MKYKELILSDKEIQYLIDSIEYRNHNIKMDSTTETLLQRLKDARDGKGI